MRGEEQRKRTILIKVHYLAYLRNIKLKKKMKGGAGVNK